MKRISTAALTVLALLGASARAQFNVVGPGSTIDGDYLRGGGGASYGLGVYNRLTAEAVSINTDTTIRWNEYVAAVVKNENHQNAMHRAFVLERRREHYNTIYQRIRENPEERDVMNGDSLNAVMEEL